MRGMKRMLILSAVVLAGACAARPDYVLRYDLDQLAFETSARDAGPGFESLPTTAPNETGAPAA